MVALQNSIDDEQEEISLALSLLDRTVTENPFIPVGPTEPQAVFLTVPEQEVLYGGAAGGGKSAGMLMAALQYVHVPGYAALLLRRSYSDLAMPGALISRSHEWLQGTAASWDGVQHQWRFPSGATVAFGYLDTENDKYRYQSAEFQFIGPDELTQFTETQYRYMFSRLRRPEGLDVPLRMRSATNPGGIGHEWVKQRFIDGGGCNRLFIPATLEENPHLDRAAYEETLQQLDPVTRRQLRHGDWDVRPEGNLFKREWFAGRIKNESAEMVRRVRYWDLAATEPKAGQDPDYTASCLMGFDSPRNFWVLDSQEFRASPKEVEDRVRATAHLDGAEVEIEIEQEPGASGKIVIDHYQRVVLPGFSVSGRRSTGDKTLRIKPFSAACQNGLVYLLRGSWISRWIDRMCSFGQPGEHDDTADATGGAHRRLSAEMDAMTPEQFAKALGYEPDNPAVAGADRLSRFMRGQE
jgi:predicted phage terminase large subunit-like protein